MLHIRQIRFISLSSANCRCSTTTCQDSLSESSHVRQNHSTWCFGLLTAIYFDVLSQYGILRGSAPRCQRVLLYFPAARCYRFVEGENTDNLLIKKTKRGRFCNCSEDAGAKMSPESTAEGQGAWQCPMESHGMGAAGTMGWFGWDASPLSRGDPALCHRHPNWAGCHRHQVTTATAKQNKHMDLGKGKVFKT